MNGLIIEAPSYEDLTPEEKQEVPDNGCGKEYASYIRVKHNGETILLENDAMEPEDAKFYRDLNWIYSIIRKAYELGKADAIKALEK